MADRKCLATLLTNDFFCAYEVFIHSFLRFNRPWFESEGYEIAILENGLSQEVKDKCLKIFPKTEFLQVNTNSYQGVNWDRTADHLKATFYKLDIFRFSQYSRIVFMDSDMLVFCSVKELFDTSEPFAAVRAFSLGRDKLRGDFNSGVLVLNSPVINEETYLKLVEISKAGATLPDQEVLNKFFFENFKELPKRFNVEKRMMLSKRYPKVLGRDIAVLHYVGPKPWQKEKGADGKSYVLIESYWWKEVNLMDREKETKAEPKIEKPAQEVRKLVLFSPRTISVRNSANAKIGLQQMAEYIGLSKEHTLLEVGSYAGDSTEVFLCYAGKVISIDPWENGYDPNDSSSYKIPMSLVEREFDRTTARFDGTIHKIKTTSELAVEQFENRSLDVVYLDGKHTKEAVWNDIQRWLPKVKVGGWLCGHDYQPKFQGVIEAVDSLLGAPEKVFPDTSWCFFRRS